MMDRRHGLAIFLTVAVSGCIPAPDDTAADLLALREAALAYQAAASAKAADQVVGMYDGDPVMVPPNAPIVEGPEGVGSYQFGFIVTPGVELEFEILRAEISTSGDMGWTLAEGQITINNDEGPPGRDVVRDFHVWRKQDDGTWKVVVDIWNSGMPASQ